MVPPPIAFPVRRIGEVAEVVPGFAFKSKDWCNTGVPVIKIRNILGDGSIDTDNADCVPESLVNPKIGKFFVHSGDVLVAMTGATAGKVGRLRSSKTFLLNQRVAKLVPIDIHPHFLWAVVSTDDYQKRFFKLADGAAQPNMSGSQIESVQIPFPVLSTQRKIASILSAYEDLIENNLRRIKILEEMAQSLYREWFVKFRFPGHEKVRMVDSPLGKIPEGWEVVPLSKVTGFISRGISPKYGNSSNIVINQKCIRNGRLNLELSRNNLRKVSDDKFVQVGDVLINSTGVGTLGRVAQILRGIENCTVDSHVTIVRPLKKTDKHFFGLQLLNLQDHFTSQGRGATGQTELGRDAVGETGYIKPPSRLQNRFGEAVEPMRELSLHLLDKNETLRQTRDLLLPRLISGELGLSDLDIDISVFEEQTNTDVPSSPNSKPEIKSKASAQSRELDQKEDSKPSQAESPTAATEVQPVSIDQWETNEVLAVFRSVGRGRGFVDREEFIRQAARELGYQRVGTRIGSALRGHIMAALRRRVLEKNGDGVRVATPSIIDYKTEELIQTLCSITRKDQRLSREEAIRETAEYLGFQRVTAGVQTSLKNAIRSAIHRGIFEGDRDDIWRVD